MRDIGPCRAHRLAPWWQEGGTVHLRAPKAGPWGTRWLEVLRLPTHARLRLDPIAAAAWLAMDGRPLAEVAQSLQQRFPDEPDLPARLGRFVSALADRGLVRLDGGLGGAGTGPGATHAQAAVPAPGADGVAGQAAAAPAHL